MEKSEPKGKGATVTIENPEKLSQLSGRVETDETTVLEGVSIIRNYLNLVAGQSAAHDSASWQNVWRNGDWANFDKSSWGNSAK